MKILYVTYTRPDYILNAVCIDGLRQNGHEVVDFHAKYGRIKGLFAALSFYRKNLDADLVFIGYDSPALAVFLRPFYQKKMIYNAFLSVYERMIVSRGVASKISPKAFYYWLLDFLAVHSADLVRLETNNQADYFNKLFKVSKKKLCRSWVGVNENNFYYDPDIKKSEVFTVLFRGAFMPEAGVEYIVRAVKILEREDVKFIIMGGGTLGDQIRKLADELKPSNLALVTEYLPNDKLRMLMQSCHVSIGQVSDHDRLSRTIPLKLFESLCMKLPYLTSANKGVLELLTPDEDCLMCEAANPESLAKKILWIKNNYPVAEKIAENGYKLYEDKLRLRILAGDLISKIKET